MALEDQIEDLLEVILETDRTPEDVCAEHPELLTEVRARLRKLRAISAQVDFFFPPAEASTGSFHERPARLDIASPSIPGYEIQMVLGRGGMGIVYKARHLKLNREVALKMLLSGTYASRQEQLRFMREAESVAALRHPNIVQIYEVGEVDGHPFYTMEYAGGGSLSEDLAGAIQPVREAAKLVSTLARAVQAAHDRGILHRDLKPANVLIDFDGTPKITDFGLARRIDQESSLTHTGARLGTPSYMAPEQMSGEASLGPPVDVFALGAMLYEMLTGKPPFRGQTISDTERKLATEDPEPLARLNPKVPRDLETICLKCLEKEPGGRYASADELANDLERFLRHEPILARPIAPAERWVRWIRRNPFPAALSLLSIVLVALVVSEAIQGWEDTVASRAERARLTSRFESGVQLVQEGRFAEARALLGKLGDGGFQDLRRRIDRVLSDLNLVEDLEAIGIKRAMSLKVRDAAWRPEAQAARNYESLIARTGLATRADDPATVAGRISTSDIRAALLAAFDDWAVCEADEARRNWVLDVARRAGDGAGDWERQCRDPRTWNDREVLARLAETAPAKAPVEQLRALGDRLASALLDSTVFRGRVQREHPDHFLANLSLADALAPTDPVESLRYYQAALAIRPRSATAHNNLAVVLANLGRSSEAVEQYEQSIRLDPNATAPRFNLGLALANDRPGEAIPHLLWVTGRDPSLASAHRALGELFLRQHRYGEAEASFVRCLERLQNGTERRQVLELIRSCRASLGQP